MLAQSLLSTLAVSSLALFGAVNAQGPQTPTAPPTTNTTTPPASNSTNSSQPSGGLSTKWTNKQHKVTLYHTAWSQYGRNFQVKDLPTDYVSDVAYAFFDLRPDPTTGLLVPTTGDQWGDFDKPFTNPATSLEPLDTVTPLPANSTEYRGNFGQFMRLKKLKQFTFSLSIGGWTYSKNFSLAVRTPQAREAFGNSIISILKRFNWIQGINFDWEYISNNGINYGNETNIVDASDDVNFQAFLTSFRAKLQANNMSKYLVTMTASAAPEKIHFDVKPYINLIDELHVMTYDFHDGQWPGEKQTRHHSNLFPYPGSKYSVSQAVDHYLNLGFPANKIMIGAAYYSRGFANSSGLMTDGAGGDPDMSWEPHVEDYKAFPKTGSDVFEYYDYDAEAAFTYDWNRKVFVSYDNVDSVRAKCKYVQDKGLLGIIIWEASGDFPIDHPRSLTKALYDCFHQ